MRKTLLIVGMFALVGGCALIASQYVSAPTIPHERIFVSEPDISDNNILEPQELLSLRVLFVGDLMLDRGVKYYVEKVGGGDYTFPFAKIKTYLDSFDAVIPNLEGPVSDKGMRVGSIYSFRMDPKVLDVFSYANIRVVNVANNHAWDYGRDAFLDTIYRLRNKNIGYFGGGKTETEAYAPYVFEKNDIRVGLLGFTEFSEYAQASGDDGGIAFTDVEKIKTAIQNAKKNDLDALIVSFHFGEEYLPEPVNRQVYLARLAIDQGVDLVVGHHPHVIESSEIYKEKNIFYSLGNFIFDQSFSEETMTPGFLEVEISKQGISSVILKKGSMTKFYEVLPPEDPSFLKSDNK